MATGEECGNYNNVLKSSASKSSGDKESTMSKNYNTIEERRWDMRRDISVGEEEPDQYKIKP